MPRVNLTDPALAYDPDDPEGYRAGMLRLGPRLGAADSGATLYELPPRQALCPYHYEYGEEEWVLVLAGRPSLRTPDGVEELAPMDIAFFSKGPAGAHQLRNDTDDPVRLIMWSTIGNPAVSAYPDSGKVGVYPGVEGESLIVERSSAVGYYKGE